MINHNVGEPAEGESRNVLVESARIARGPVMNLADLKVDGLDAVIFPGGFGAAKNLCSYAFDGPELKVHPEVERVTVETVKAGKPLGTICIAPVATAKALAGADIKVTVTIGNDPDTAGHIEGFGATHQACPVDDIVVDAGNKVVSTPAYMLAGSIKEAAAGIEKLVAKVLELAG